MPSTRPRISVTLPVAAAQGDGFKILGQAAWVGVRTSLRVSCLILEKSLSLPLGLRPLRCKMRVMLDST